MQSLIKRVKPAKPAKADPAPSRWAWRMQRLMLTPTFRFGLRVGVPFCLALAAGTIYLSDEARRGQLADVYANARTSIQQRPEFMVKLMAIDGVEGVLAADVRAAVPVEFPTSSFDLDLPALRQAITDLPGVKQASLRVKPGDFGTVVEVRVFNRHGVEKDERALQIEREEIERLARDRDDELAILDRNIYARLSDLILGKVAVKGPRGVRPNSEITQDLLDSLSRGQWWQLAIEDEEDAKIVEALNEQYEAQKRQLDARFEDKVEKVRRGDDLPPGVMKMVKVFIAVKRKLQPGDKMAGRHGNKGVISRVVPMEDMPFLADGTPVDFCLNPLGVPSRMNVGQILETHMGWAARGLGIKVDDALDEYRRSGDLTPVREAMRIAYGDEVYEEGLSDMDENRLLEAAGNVARGVPIATPVFDGAKEGDVNDALVRAGFSESGQSVLFDGRTGEQFSRPVTVGVKYLLKLHHLVDDKIHARSTGPYSLVTQQPLGGKAQFGGQRFGEMEVWALEAYGAAYTLQEMLTVKSDDVAGRTKVYESIVKGEDNFEAGVPESFNVLVKEVRGLGLNMELLDAEEDE